MSGTDDSGATPPGDPAQPGRYREITLSAILFAVVIGVVMNAAITYSGLKIGFTIGGSAIAAVLGFGVLRGILRKGTILETNIAQTVASAINTPNSGIIFTVPVLFLVGLSLTAKDVDFWLITLAAVAGAMLGTAFIIPLRKQMIDIERLRFPTGTGVAAILKSPGAGPKKALVLVLGIVVATLVYLPAGLPGLKRTADLDSLDRLFDQGRITQVQRVRTRQIARWIQTEQAPQVVLEVGSLAGSADQARAAWQDDQTDPQLKQVLDDREAALDAAPDRFEVGGVSIPFSRDLALAAYEASQGQRPWSTLRSRRLGWAGDPFFGYADLGWRLPRTLEPDGTTTDLNGDGIADEQLTARVDRDQDGRPDLILNDDTVDVGRFLGLPDQFALVFGIAPFALGAGYITGRNGLLVLAGGILAYFVLTPVAFSMGWMPETLPAREAPGYGFTAFNRPLGIGLLLGGAMMGVLVSLPAIREAIKSVAAAGRVRGGVGDELGLKPLVVAALAALVLLFIAAVFVGNRPINSTDPVTGEHISAGVGTTQYQGYAIAFASDESSQAWQDWPSQQRDEFLQSINARPGWLSGLNPVLRAAIIALVGALWIWLAGIIIAQCTGMTDWSPISGMALLTVVLVMLLAGSGAVVGAVLIGAALCVAITLAADMMQDLRTGYLVGARPRGQQIVELCVTGIGPVVTMLTILLIAEVNMKSHGAAFGPGTPTSAPQAQALAAVITGVQGGQMPYVLYGLGALLGALLGLGSFAGLGVLVGLSMYLPFEAIATYGIGCIIAMVVARVKGKNWAEEWGVPLAAGLIVGESLTALVINMIVLKTG